VNGAAVAMSFYDMRVSVIKNMWFSRTAMGGRVTCF
jgi:hypothetical protein